MLLTQMFTSTSFIMLKMTGEPDNEDILPGKSEGTP